MTGATERQIVGSLNFRRLRESHWKTGPRKFANREIQRVQPAKNHERLRQDNENYAGG
jgi:hypothetical protein